MKRPNSILTLSLVFGSLLIAGLACGGSSTTTTNNTAAPANNSTATSSTPAPSAPKSIAGNYTTTGSNPDGGGQYKADLVITPRDDVYQFSWKSGTSSYDGVGVMTDARVAVAYTDGANGKGCGVVLYKIGSDGAMDGKIGYWGVNSMETERATRTKGSGSDLDGVYDIVGKNPEGKEYKGKLTVIQSGEGYTFDWEAGNAFSGFGIKAGNYVAVGFGGKQCAFVGYDVEADGTLNGRWGNQVTRKLGTEVAKKK
ncbi:MAG: hypothetical protein WBC19_11580 [Pyrinomonadaceae bacterium]